MILFGLKFAKDCFFTFRLILHLPKEKFSRHYFLHSRKTFLRQLSIRIFSKKLFAYNFLFGFMSENFLLIVFCLDFVKKSTPILIFQTDFHFRKHFTDTIEIISYNYMYYILSIRIKIYFQRIILRIVIFYYLKKTNL